jgi:hypothetical protein
VRVYLNRRKNMPDDSKVNREPTSWFTIIPDFFYEVIGRIIPGGTFIFLLTYTIGPTFLCDLILKQKINGTQINPSYTLIFILFLGFSYSLGYLLTPFGHCLGKYTYIKWQYNNEFKECSGDHKNWIWEKTYDKLYEEKKSEKEEKKESVKKEEKENKKGLTPDEIESLFQCQHDQVRIKCPDLIRSLAKSQADVQLCINTSAAFLLVLVVSIIKCIACKEPWINCIVFFLFAVGFWFAAYYRNKRFLARQFSFSREAEKKEKKSS